MPLNLEHISRDQKTSGQQHRLGPALVTLMPHQIDTIGARVFLILDEPRVHYSINLTPADARALANYLTLAAAEAEAMERRAQMKTIRRQK